MSMPVWRAAGSLREQVLAHPLRADGAYEEPRYPGSPRASSTISSDGWGLLSCPATAKPCWGKPPRKDRLATRPPETPRQSPCSPPRRLASPRPPRWDRPRHDGVESGREACRSSERQRAQDVRVERFVVGTGRRRSEVDLNGTGTFANRAEQFASFQTDAPSCDNCGAITVRNGNCYLCHNCGNSMGCS